MDEPSMELSDIRGAADWHADPGREYDVLIDNHGQRERLGTCSIESSSTGVAVVVPHFAMPVDTSGGTFWGVWGTDPGGRPSLDYVLLLVSEG